MFALRRKKNTVYIYNPNIISAFRVIIVNALVEIAENQLHIIILYCKLNKLRKIFPHIFRNRDSDEIKFYSEKEYIYRYFETISAYCTQLAKQQSAARRRRIEANTRCCMLQSEIPKSDPAFISYGCSSGGGALLELGRRIDRGPHGKRTRAAAAALTLSLFLCSTLFISLSLLRVFLYIPCVVSFSTRVYLHFVLRGSCSWKGARGKKKEEN